MSASIITVIFDNKLQKITLIMVSETTNNARVEWKEEFNDWLETAVISLTKRDNLMLMGEMNAKLVPSEMEERQRTISLKLNWLNKKMVHFWSIDRFVIEGKLFLDKTYYKIAWVSADGSTENQIDRILLS